jgi:hypothetical protein
MYGSFPEIRIVNVIPQEGYTCGYHAAYNVLTAIRDLKKGCTDFETTLGGNSPRQHLKEICNNAGEIVSAVVATKQGEKERQKALAGWTIEDNIAEIVIPQIEKKYSLPPINYQYHVVAFPKERYDNLMVEVEGGVMAEHWNELTNEITYVPIPQMDPKNPYQGKSVPEIFIAGNDSPCVFNECWTPAVIKALKDQSAPHTYGIIFNPSNHWYGLVMHQAKTGSRKYYVFDSLYDRSQLDEPLQNFIREVEGLPNTNTTTALLLTPPASNNAHILAHISNGYAKIYIISICAIALAAYGLYCSTKDTESQEEEPIETEKLRLKKKRRNVTL